MSGFTLDDLARLMRGPDDAPVALGRNELDTQFAELGVDSLAVLELCSRVGREYGVHVPDDAVARMSTPRAAVDYVNELLGARPDAIEQGAPGIGHTDNEIVILAPMDLVWTMTNDVSSWPTLFSEYSAAEILERDGATVRFRLTMRPDEQGNAWSWVSERTAEEASHTVRSRRLETGWFEHMDIYWEYRPAGDGVAMRWVQDFRMKPDSPVGDEAMTRRINDNTAAQMIRIKQIVERVAATGSAGPADTGGAAGTTGSRTETGAGR